MKYLWLLATFSGLALAVHRIDPLVSTKVGLIRGLRDDKGYAKFLGVPYGKVGENVFGVAEPHPVFDDIFEAYDDSNKCVQIDRYSGAATGTIDCLKLNIYVPDKANANHRLPVMVWIHGGGFAGGQANFGSGDPYSLLKHDVIVVALSYRVGVFGFMCLDIPEVPGNTGLKDQVLALRWINENIEAFGGDANQVTVFGQSAGGMSVNLHLFSLNEKLFTRVIIQSGPALSYGTIVESDITIPFAIAKELGFNTTDINEVLSVLIGVDAHIIAEAAYKLKITQAGDTDPPFTKPCVEQEFEDVEQFITEHPMNMKSSKASTTPVIIGYNNNEYAGQYANAEAEFFDTYDFSKILALGFDLNNELTEALEVVRHFFIGDEDTSENVRWEIANFGSDLIFNHPTHRMTQRLLESGAKSVYTYVFSYSGSNSMNNTWPGAAHNGELMYLFDSKEMCPMCFGEEDVSSNDQIVADRLAKLWTNFAKYGNPTPETSDLLPITWTPITATTYPCLAIDSDLSLENRPFQERMAFWDLFYKLYGHYQKWYKA